MDKLKERLQNDGIWDDKLEAEIKALYKYGINCIRDGTLRDAVEGFLCTVPAIFFTDHASRSGRFHPPWQNGRHGTLRSIIESCVLVPPMARYIPELVDEKFKVDTHAIDVALAATIISDTYKKADKGDIHYGPDHGRVAAEAWRAFALSRGFDPAVVEEVVDGSIWHYGIYTPGFVHGTPLSPVSRLVHLCDAFTAQKELALIYQAKTVVE